MTDLWHAPDGKLYALTDPVIVSYARTRKEKDKDGRTVTVNLPPVSYQVVTAVEVTK
jgi:hypothetical protein